MDNLKEKKEEIFKKIFEYYQLKKEKEIIPGKDIIPYARKVYDEKELINLVDSALDFWLTEGDYAAKFEKRFAGYFGLKSCSLVNSGSSANLLALTSLTSYKLEEGRLKPGDEVITVAAGFPTTVNPIIQNGLIPVFVDVDLDSYNVNVKELKNAISKKTKAIMLAHTLGNPFDLESVMQIAKDNNLYVIEDMCDAIGSKYQDKLVGTFGDISTASFYPAHHITMGEGGAVLVNSISQERIIRSFRDWGRDCYCKTGKDNSCGKRFTQQFGELPYGYDHKYVYSHIGYNLKILDLQAAIGLAQLDKLPSFITKRRENFNILSEGLEKFNKYLIMPKATEKSEPSWFAFPITIKKDVNINRNDLVQYLEENKIMTRLLFGGNLTKQPAYKNVKYRKASGLYNTDYIMNNTFFIGIYPGLYEVHMNYIIDIFKKYFDKKW
jgi:CDP-4-dehydro-6-deoxyglucose reductase, E1